MKTFEYKITDETGIHARPAGLLVKEAAKYKSDIKLLSKNKSADCKKLFAVMALGIKKNDDLTLTFEGVDEEKACAAIEEFFKKNL